jgi:hypothetical protein
MNVREMYAKHLERLAEADEKKAGKTLHRTKRNLRKAEGRRKWAERTRGS